MSENFKNNAIPFGSLKKIIIPCLYIIILILFFVKWIDMSGVFGYGASGYSIIQYLKTTRQTVALYGSYIDPSAKADTMMVYALMLYGYIISIVACVASSILTVLKRNAWLRVIGFMVSIVYTILMIFPVDMLSDDVSAQVAAAMISYTAAPYMILVLSGVGIALSFISKRAVSTSTDRMRNTYEIASSEIPARKTSHERETVPESAKAPVLKSSLLSARDAVETRTEYTPESTRPMKDMFDRAKDL